MHRSTPCSLLSGIASLSTALGSPHWARQASTCGSVASSIAGRANATAFCGSYLEVATETITVSQTIWGPGSVTEIGTPTTVSNIVATSTLTFCSAGSTQQKRAALPQSQYSSDPPLWVDVSSACSCLGAIPTPCTVVTQTYHYQSTTTQISTYTTQATSYVTYVGQTNSTSSTTYLPSPTLLTDLGADGLADDQMYEITDVPFPIGFGNVSSSNTSVYASVNGVLSLSAGGFAGYLPLALPAFRGDQPHFLADTAFTVFWSDLWINPASDAAPYPPQHIQYATQGTAPNRTFTVEWVASHAYRTELQLYRFWITFFEGSAKFRYTFWDVDGPDGEQGLATVGAQSLVGNDDASAFTGIWSQFTPGIRTGLVLDYNVETNNFDASTVYEGQC
ncbi:hypothetical protein AAFC00_006632 [Neodothiora populina]|uniref:Uncharacterized protein n=1 Tax=Neodothiora populina TaxID=2781224 RepID=A0ABR3PAY5_9PEZI